MNLGYYANRVKVKNALNMLRKLKNERQNKRNKHNSETMFVMCLPLMSSFSLENAVTEVNDGLI